MQDFLSIAKALVTGIKWTNRQICPVQYSHGIISGLNYVSEIYCYKNRSLRIIF